MMETDESAVIADVGNCAQIRARNEIRAEFMVPLSVQDNDSAELPQRLPLVVRVARWTDNTLAGVRRSWRSFLRYS
jgi:hypothetical protein